jgi:hypothetical protein
VSVLDPVGRQVVEEVPSAKALFDRASEILGYDLLERAKNGPKDALDSTVSILFLPVIIRSGASIKWSDGQGISE